MRHMWRSSESGFTVVELALVMVIVAMVVGVFSQMLISANQSASISKAKVEISRNMHNSMDADIEVIRIQVAPLLIPKRTHLYYSNMLQIWAEAPILGRLYI